MLCLGPSTQGFHCLSHVEDWRCTRGVTLDPRNGKTLVAATTKKSHTNVSLAARKNVCHNLAIFVCLSPTIFELGAREVAGSCPLSRSRRVKKGNLCCASHGAGRAAERGPRLGGHASPVQARVGGLCPRARPQARGWITLGHGHTPIDLRGRDDEEGRVAGRPTQGGRRQHLVRQH